MLTANTRSTSSSLLSIFRTPRAVLGGLCLALASCASIVSTNSRPVKIASNPAGADFTIKNGHGAVVMRGTTPMTVELYCGKGYFRPARYTVEYTRKGETRTATIGSGINGWWFGNVVFGGWIGLLIVDPATGAMWKLKDNVSVSFTQTAGHSEKRTLKILTIHQIPVPMRNQLVALN